MADSIVAQSAEKTIFDQCADEGAARRTAMNRAELLDEVMKHVTQADAMAHMTYGNSGETFRCMSHDLQDEFLWALSDRIGEARALLDSLARGAMPDH